ncbi:Energy-coupling factor transporter transmembrane protein EcfT [Candidatus Lokiarchaeum ossiferum]|uniref:Energy-coupling factor transporter transmembrane protein EcfT n=1 Tax=Candidatus Lokiarchaeum ossiferum TaxID=2951803 RepID=A0ABY6HTV9_9ARCH|nr:Energy-coupling factor transporter transmembrane protein EcfT [Candidatus Lokiarchaeum sp. B-35]
MSMEFAKVFNFLRGTTLIHQIDPRAKGMMILSYSVLAFVLNDFWLLMGLFLLALPLLFIAKIAPQFFQGMKGLSVLLFIILIINTYAISFYSALTVIMRILILMIVFSTYFQTTIPEDITQSLIKVKVPYSIAYALSLSFRFVPTMAKETEIISEAQLSRGHKLEVGGMINQIKNLFPLLIPLLMSSIRRAFHVAEALETRAFGVKKHPNYYFPLKFKKMDWWVTIFYVVFLAGVIVLWSTESLKIPSWLLFSL